MFAVAVQFLELVERDHLAVDAEHLVAVVAGPVGEWFMVALPASQEGGAEVEWASCLLLVTG